jgi:hypothetical protein
MLWKGLGGALLGAWALWSTGAIVLGGSGPSGLRLLTLLVLWGSVIGVGAVWRRSVEETTGAVVLVCILATSFFFALRPLHGLDWMEDQERLPSVSVDGDVITIDNYRQFRYRSEFDWDAHWSTQTFRFSELVGADMGIEQFASLEAIAHTFVSFRFEDGRVLVASIEIRKEKGEDFSPIKGLFRQYERMVVLGDERDMVELRAIHREDTVYLHPVDVSAEYTEAFLRSILEDAQTIEAKPVFYNTLTASCSTSLAKHIRAVGPVGWDYRMALPGYVDVIAWELGWFGEEPLDVLRDRHTINERAVLAAGQDDFSMLIRAQR